MHNLSSLFPFLVGAGFGGGVVYMVAEQLRKLEVELAREKARREALESLRCEAQPPIYKEDGGFLSKKRWVVLFPVQVTFMGNVVGRHEHRVLVSDKPDPETLKLMAQTMVLAFTAGGNPNILSNLATHATSIAGNLGKRVFPSTSRCESRRTPDA